MRRVHVAYKKERSPFGSSEERHTFYKKKPAEGILPSRPVPGHQAGTTTEVVLILNEGKDS